VYIPVFLELFFVQLGAVQIGAQEDDGALNGILGIVPGLFVIAVVEFFAEPADVLAELIEIGLDHAGTFLGKLGEALLVETRFAYLKEHAIVGKAEIGLGAELGREILVVIPKVNNGFCHVLEIEVDAAADIAGALQLFNAGEGL
jgi:hypothetical protein